MDDAVEARVEEYATKRSVYVTFAEALDRLFRQLLDVGGVEVSILETRAKSIDSARAKLASHPTYNDLSDVKDLCGVRIVVPYAADIEVVRDICEAELALFEEQHHGAERPEAFGYQSLHVIARLEEPRASLGEWQLFRDLDFEIQIRSVLQHAWALISHKLDYKTEEAVPPSVRRRLFRVAALLETGDEIFDSFRSSIEEVRREYESDVAEDGWRSLPVDRDSLRAAFEAMRWQSVMEAAIPVGFRTNDEQMEFEFVEPRVLSVAKRLGLTTLGDLDQAIDRFLRADLAPLQRVAERAADLGFRPWAVPTDVLILFLLVVERPDLARDADFVHGLEFMEEIEEAMQDAVRPGG